MAKSTYREKQRRYKNRSQNLAIYSEAEKLKDLRKSIELSQIKKDELEKIKAKFHLSDRCIRLISSQYHERTYLPNYNLTNIASLFALVLKYLYNFSDEEMTELLSRELSIFTSNYNEVRLRLALFYHYNLLDDILSYRFRFLNDRFPRKGITAKELYFIIEENKISSVEELRTYLDHVDNSELIKLKKKYPNVAEKLLEFDKQFINKVKRNEFMKNYNQRRLAKKL